MQASHPVSEPGFPWRGPARTGALGSCGHLAVIWSQVTKGTGTERGGSLCRHSSGALQHLQGQRRRNTCKRDWGRRGSKHGRSSEGSCEDAVHHVKWAALCKSWAASLPKMVRRLLYIPLPLRHSLQAGHAALWEEWWWCKYYEKEGMPAWEGGVW